MISAVSGMNYIRKPLYPLQPKQQQAADTVKIFRLYGGAKGGGKSYWLRSEATRQCLSAPGINGLILRRTFPEVEKNFLYPFQNEVPSTVYRYNGQNHIVKFYNGSKIELGFCKNLVDVLRYQGIEYDFIGIEEITHWSEDEFDTIISSLRSTKDHVTANFFCTGNPGGRGHAWVKKRWVSREPSPDGDKYDLDDYAFIPAKYTDNLILLQKDPNYVKRLNALPDKIRRAYRDGDWDLFEGQFFDEFRKELHVVPAFHPPKGVKKRLISFDYGYTAPSAVYWHAQLYDGTIVTYRELYVTKHTYRQLAAKIMAMTPDWEWEEIQNNVFCDPAIFGKNESTGRSAEDDMFEMGLVINRADNKRIPGWITVREGLQLYEDPNTHNVRSRWVITESCPELIRTLPSMVHDAKNVEDMDTKLEDHACDGVRYGLREFEWPEIDTDFLIGSNQAMMKKSVQIPEISIKYGQSQQAKKEEVEDDEYDEDDDHSILNSNF